MAIPTRDELKQEALDKQNGQGRDRADVTGPEIISSNAADADRTQEIPARPD